MNPTVKRARALEGYQLELVFSNGEKRIFDVRPYLDYPVFRELKNPSLFKAVRPFLGSIAWKNGQDLCPDTLYEESRPGRAVVAESRAAYGRRKGRRPKAAAKA
jgi:hypothetical protein